MMEQLALFAEAGRSKGLPTDFLEYFPGLFNRQESDLYLQKFISETAWKQTVQKLYDKEVVTPRLTAWYGDLGTDYSHPGRISNPTPWTAELLAIKAIVEPLAGSRFNSVLLNYYRDGNDSVAWHSGKDKVSGIIADFTSAESINNLIRQLPQVDILINNVAIFEPKAFADITDKDWLRFFRDKCTEWYPFSPCLLWSNVK